MVSLVSLCVAPLLELAPLDGSGPSPSSSRQRSGIHELPQIRIQRWIFHIHSSSQPIMCSVVLIVGVIGHLCLDFHCLQLPLHLALFHAQVNGHSSVLRVQQFSVVFGSEKLGMGRGSSNTPQVFDSNLTLQRCFLRFKSTCRHDHLWRFVLLKCVSLKVTHVSCCCISFFEVGRQLSLSFGGRFTHLSAKPMRFSFFVCRGQCVNLDGFCIQICFGKVLIVEEIMHQNTRGRLTAGTYQCGSQRLRVQHIAETRLPHLAD